MTDTTSYPKRPSHFGIKYVRLLAKACVANELGAEAAMLLAVVAATEDARHYRGPVNFWNGQLMPLIGCRSDSALRRVRERCERAGWLVHRPGTKWSPPSYWVVVPAKFGGWDDAPTDEGYEVNATNKPQPEQASGGQAAGEGSSKGEQAASERTDSIPVPVPKDNNTSCCAAAEPPPAAGPSSPAIASAKPARKRKPPTAPHPVAVETFCTMWGSTHNDTYPFNGGKDGAAVSHILAAVGGDVSRFRVVVERYLANTDPFYAGHPLSLLRAQLPRFLVDVSQQHHPPRRGFETQDERLADLIADTLGSNS